MLKTAKYFFEKKSNQINFSGSEPPYISTELHHSSSVGGLDIRLGLTFKQILV